MAEITIYENGVVRVFDPEDYEYVKLFLNLDDTDHLRVSLKVKETDLYSNKLYKKQEIPMEEIHQLLAPYDLRLSQSLLDHVRTTPDFANHYTTILQEALNSAQSGLVVEPMKSYEDGYSFVGDAFLYFVTALVTYYLYPHEKSNRLHYRASILRSNKFIAATALTTTWAKYLASRGIHPSNIKPYSGSFRGLIGALFVEGGMPTIVPIFTFLNEVVFPEMILPFGMAQKRRMGWEGVGWMLVAGVVGWGLGWAMGGGP